VTLLDWVLLAGIGFSVLVAASQGFAYEAFSLAGAVVGFLLAAWEYERLVPWYLPHVRSGAVAALASFLTIFFLVVLAAGVIARLARWAAHSAGLAWFDRLLGAAFGLVRGLIIATVIVMGIAAFRPDSRAVADSALGRYFLVTGRAASWLAPPEVRQKFREGVIAIRTMRERNERPGAPERRSQ
jgi:membrane protein required for colicin V production